MYKKNIHIYMYIKQHSSCVTRYFNMVLPTITAYTHI